MTQNLHDSYDIFLSYASENREWVKEHLHQPLLACRTESGERPKIFLDVSPEGIPPGANYLGFLASALQRSRFIVPVYSLLYFEKKMCRWELSLACQIDPSASGILLPVCIDPEALKDVPFMVSIHQWLSTDSPDWFGRLAHSVGLTLVTEPPALSFPTGPSDVFVNHTLPEVQIAVVASADQSMIDSAEQITIRAENGDLQGTLTVTAEAGLATFRDLSFSTPTPGTRLIAEAPGCSSAESDPFAVKTPPQRSVGRSSQIVTKGNLPVFFADGETLAVLGKETLEIFSPDGARVGEAEFGGRVRLSARSGDYLAFADWSGRVVLVRRDGCVRTVSLAKDSRVLAVPGGLCLAEDKAYVGLWNGGIWAISLESSEPEQQLEHPAGVQMLQVVDDKWAIVGLDGKLTIHHKDGRTEVHDLAPALLALQGWPDCVIGIDESAVYRFGFESGRTVREGLPVTRVVEAITESNPAIVVDSNGKGVRFDKQLSIRDAFHTTRGARLIAADRVGRSVVFAYPDGSYAVMLGERVVFSTMSGPITISPDGDRVALVSDNTAVISPVNEIFSTADEGGAS